MIYYVGEQRSDVECTSLEHAIDYCSKLDICGLDIETSRKFPKGEYDETIYTPGLDPYLSNICMIQIGDVNTQFVIDSRKVELTPSIGGLI